MNKRRYANRHKSFGKGLLIFIVVVILAVGAGYGLTEYVITPYFLETGTEDTENQDPPQEGFDGSSIIIDQQDVNTEGEETSVPAPEVAPPAQQGTATDSTYTNVLYSIQYGSFSDLAGAEVVASSLAVSNIPVMVMQKDGAYKLIGTPYITKEEAQSSLERAKAVAGDDLFITTVEVRME